MPLKKSMLNYSDWINATKHVLYKRSSELKKLDVAIKKYSKSKSKNDLSKVERALTAWKSNKKDWKNSIRNRSGAINKLAIDIRNQTDPILIFSSSNPYYSRQTQVGSYDSHGSKDFDRRFGWCAAASAIWCSNILLKNREPDKSNPDKLHAGVLQVKYRWDDAAGEGEDILNLLKHVSLRGQHRANMSRDRVLSYMGSNPGVYHFSNDGHSMAMDTRIGRNYWYDIESGLHKFSSVNSMKRGVRSQYNSGGNVWSAVKCSK